MAQFGPRFWESTRGQLVALLRRGTLTVEEMAQSLGITDNAVRSHLTVLERDALGDGPEPHRLRARRGWPGPVRAAATTLRHRGLGHLRSHREATARAVRSGRR